MIRDFFNSFWNVQAYPVFLARKKRQVIGFVLMLTLIFWGLTLLIPCGGFYLKSGGLRNYIQHTIPNFELSGGKLHLDAPFHLENATVYIDINTEEGHHLAFDSQDVKTRLALSDIVLLADADHMLYQTTARSGFQKMERKELAFSDLGDETFVRADILKAVPIIRTMIILILVLAYWILLAGFLIWALVVAGFGLLLARFLHVPMRYGKIYRLSIYTQSLPMLIGALIQTFGFILPEFTAVSLLYSLLILAKVFRFMRDSGNDRVGVRRGFDDSDTRRSFDDSDIRQGGDDSDIRRGFVDSDIRRQEERNRGTFGQESPGPGFGSKEENEDSGEAGEKREAFTEPENKGDRETGQESGTGTEQCHGLSASPGSEQQKADGARRMILPKAHARSDLQPSEGWSFGTRQEDPEGTTGGQEADQTGKQERAQKEREDGGEQREA